MSLRDQIKAISPTWLQGDVGERYLYSAAIVLDAAVDRLEQGACGCAPQKCDPSYLPYIGRDRSTVRGLSATDANFAIRCKTAIYDWHFAGLAAGLMRTILGYLSPAAPAIRVVWSAKWSGSQPTQWYSIADGAEQGATPVSWSTQSPTGYVGEWQWDAIDNRRRCWVILYVNSEGAPWITRGRKYGDGSKYGDGHLYGVGGITANQIATLRTLCRAWKSAHAYIPWIVVSFDDASFDPFAVTSPGANATLPDGEWANWGKDDGAGNYIAARFATARYISGVG
jgi:hypothetical protein